jgi:pilus assembly protein FimV
VAKKTQHTASNFRLRTTAWAVASSLAFAALPSLTEAAGLGKITVFSALGQPLRAEMELIATREELSGMKAQLASPSAFKQAGVEYTPTLSGITLVIDKRANGQAVIRLSSSRPINDPFVDLLLELNWPNGRLLREYTFLLDPPEFAARSTTAALPVTRPVVAARPADRPSPDERLPRASRARASEQRPVSAEASDTYEVQRGETLSTIAAGLRPQGVSLDQMLLGLFRANPDAFDRGNINRLKAGKILSIPDPATLAAIPRNEAKTVVVAQSADWGVYRRKLAGVAAEVPAREEGGRQQAAGKVTTRVEDRSGPATEPKDQLKVSKTEIPGAPLPPSTRRTDEDLIAKEKALQDANERLASLERNVAELKRLVELKSQSLADLEKQSADMTGASPPAAAPAPPAAAAAPAPVEPPPAPAPGSEALPPPERQPEVKADVPPVSEPPKAVEVPKPKVVVPVVPPEEPGFFEDLLGNPTVLAGGGGILALLAAYWFVKRRRPSDSESPLEESRTLAPLGDSMATKSVFLHTGGQNVDTSNSMGQTDFSQAGPGSIDTDEVDPVAEADVYMAYGRDAQAEEILLEAKQKDPLRYAIHIKLLEIYCGRQEAKPFGILARELFDGTGGVGPDWEKAVAMGLQIDPRNPLFAAVGDAAPATQDPEATVVDPAVGMRETFPRPLQPSARVDAVPPPPPVLSPRVGLVKEAAPVAAKPAAVELADLDFDFGGREETRGTPDDTALETTLAFPNPAHADALDFDLATTLPEAMTLPPEADTEEVRLIDDPSSFDATQLFAPTRPSSTVQADSGLDFEFDLQADSPGESKWDEKTLTQATPDEAPDIASADADALEFDVRLTESTVLGEAMQHPAFDFSSISLDLAEAEQPVAEDEPLVIGALDFSFEAEQSDTLVNPDFSIEPAETDLDAPFTSGPDTVTEFDISSSEEVATKLDLAKAYQEMGDLEGARELLQEVVSEGDAGQREAALNLLSGLRE